MTTLRSGAVAANPFRATAGSVGTGLAGLGILGSTGLFGGGGKVVNPYAPDANADYTNADTNAANASGAGNALVGAGEGALGRYQSFAPQDDAATANELNYLNTNPYTDAYSQAKLNQATGGTMQNYAAARARGISDAAARGLGGGGESSTVSGGQASIDAAEAGTISGAQNNIAIDAIRQRGENLALAHQIAAQHASSLFDQGSSGAQGGSSILTGAGHLYDTTGNNWLNEGEQQIQNTQGSNNAASSGWGALAGVGMKFAGL